MTKAAESLIKRQSTTGVFGLHSGHAQITVHWRLTNTILIPVGDRVYVFKK